MKLQHCKTCINFENGCCYSNRLTKPVNVKQIKVCPCFMLIDGKYKFQKVKDILKTDIQYIKQLLEGKADISIENKDLFKEQLQLLIQEEIENTTNYLKELQTISELK